MILGRIRAFTLLEVIIVMIISSILVALLYSILLKLNAGVINFQNKVQKSSENLLFESSFVRDFNNSRVILIEPISIIEDLKVLSMHTEIDSVTYFIDDRIIVRNSRKFSDTFLFKSVSMNLSEMKGTHMINSIDMCLIKDDTICFTCTKEYPLKYLIENKIIRNLK